MSVWKIHIKKKIAILAILIMMSGIALRVYSGSTPPGPGIANSVGTYNVPNGSLKQIQSVPFRPYNGTSNMQNSTMTFDVLGIEGQQPATGVVFNVTTTGALAVKFIGSKPTVICTSCSQSYSGNRELVTYSGTVTDVLTVIWSGLTGTLTEAKKVLFLDDFIYP